MSEPTGEFVKLEREQQIASVCEGRRVVYIKGFASGLLWHATTKAQLDLHMEQYQRGAVFVWDAGAFAVDSFTSFVLELMEKYRTSMTHSFLCVTLNAKQTVANWQNLIRRRVYIIEAPRVAIEAMDKPNQYVALGLFGLRRTGAKEVICLGGGETLLAEIRSAPDDVMYTIFQFKRERTVRFIDDPCFSTDYGNPCVVHSAQHRTRSPV